MQAYIQTRYGGPDAMELRDVPKPSPGPGELLIQVHAAGLNPIDVRQREGAMRVIRRYRFPLVAGSELAGVVGAVGAGVSGFAEGDRVFARVDKAVLGAFAEFAVVRAELVAKMPGSVDFATAAGVPLAGLTALQCLRDELRVEPGQKIFISGGAGGVGTFAIQIAKWLGAYVATTASSRGVDLVRKLGADTVVNYTREEFDEVLRDYDGAFDLLGGETLARTFGVIKPGAKVVSIAGIPEPLTAGDLHAGPMLAALFGLASAGIRRRARRHGVVYRYIFMHPSGSELAELAGLIDQGKLKVTVDNVFSFSRIGEAFAYLEAGHAKGKVVVRMGE